MDAKSLMPPPDLELKESGAQYIRRQLGALLYFRLLHRRPPTSSLIAAIPTEFVGQRICLWGTLEPREIELLKRIIAGRDMTAKTFLDIGANVGCYTIALAGSFGAVCAFEPNRIPLELLNVNVRLNRLSNVTVFDVGLSDADGECVFHENTRNLGASHFVSNAQPGSVTSTLPLRRGDDLLRTFPPVGFIKCDVEGMELSVFRGLANIIARDKPLIFFEAMKSSVGQGCVDYLRSLGYRNFSILGEEAIGLPGPKRWIRRTIRGVSFGLWPIEHVDISGDVNILASA